MNKKLPFLFSLLLAVPFAFTLASNIDTSYLSALAEEEGEYHGYTYTQEGAIRTYDTHELTPSIVSNFWAPTGYKFTMEITDEQIATIFDQAEGLEIDYDYACISLSYRKFGMDVSIDTYFDHFANKEAMFDWIKLKINEHDPFYEVSEVPLKTNLSLSLDFSFSAAGGTYKFTFNGDNFTVEPLKVSDLIEVKANYTDNLIIGQQIKITGEPVKGFFYEEPSYNEWGYHTDTMGPRKIDGHTYDNCAVFTLTLFAYKTMEIGKFEDGVLNVTYPSFKLPVSAKLEFVSGGQEIELWSNEFSLDNPDFSVTIDGYDDRSSVQINLDNDYALGFNNVNEEKVTGLKTKATAKPLRLKNSGKLEEFYDLTVEPENTSDYFLRIAESSDYSEPNYEYSFMKVDENHYQLKNVPLATSTKVKVSEDSISFTNSSTWSGCHFTLDESNVISMTDSGVYDIDFYLEETDNNHIHFNLVSPYTPNTKAFTFNVVSGGETNSYALTQSGSDANYFVSENVNLVPGDEIYVTDSDQNRISNTQTWECSGFDLTDNKMIVSKGGKYDVNFHIYSSRGANIVLTRKVLPETGREGYVYYIASSSEVRLHSEGKDDEFLDKPAGGKYYQYHDGVYHSFEGITLFDFDSDEYEGSETDYIALTKTSVSFDFIGNWYIALEVYLTTPHSTYSFTSHSQTIESMSRDKRDDYIVLKKPGSSSSLPNDVNLLLGADDLEIYINIPSYQPGVKYYYGCEVEKDGVVSFTDQKDGKYVFKPLASGVTTVIFSAECELFPKIEKAISIRVLDSIFDVAKIAVPNEFHYAGKDLTASLSIRGFTKIQNIDVSWTITNKDGEKIPEENVITNSDATVTLKNTDSEDYTIAAYYQGVKLDEITVQVRYADLNKFLRINVWWIVLITIAFVAVLFALNFILRRGKTTADNIQKIYDVFCHCVSNNELTLEELKTIKKTITRGLNRCEDLNVEGFNQYEKSIRYLRKTLQDINVLIKKWGKLTKEQQSAVIEQLNLDLSKAVSVAREIEIATDQINKYHQKANVLNYEIGDENAKHGTIFDDFD